MTVWRRWRCRSVSVGFVSADPRKAPGDCTSPGLFYCPIIYDEFSGVRSLEEEAATTSSSPEPVVHDIVEDRAELIGQPKADGCPVPCRLIPQSQEPLLVRQPFPRQVKLVVHPRIRGTEVQIQAAGDPEAEIAIQRYVVPGSVVKVLGRPDSDGRITPGLPL